MESPAPHSIHLFSPGAFSTLPYTNTQFMNTEYDTIEEIPFGTPLALADDGDLIIKMSGVPNAWIRADLGATNVSANTDNNR